MQVFHRIEFYTISSIH